MPWYEEYIRTHRCAESLKHKCSIRFVKERFGKDQWNLRHQDYCSEWDTWGLSLPVDGIHYCPFCGEKLQEDE